MKSDQCTDFQIPSGRKGPRCAFVVYIAIVLAFWTVVDVDYGNVANSVDAALKGIVITIGTGAVFLINATSVLGWWRPAMSEGRRCGSKWLFAIPGLLYLSAAPNLAKLLVHESGPSEGPRVEAEHY
jgi:hypothetical protein